MSKARDYKPSDIKRLFAFSGNQCAEPNCRRPVIGEDGETVVGKICHIEAASKKGPRFNKKMSDDERRSFDNLILLCDEHHSIIDNENNVTKYPKELLKLWKKEHQSLFEKNEIDVKEKIISDSLDNLVNSIAQVFEVSKHSNKIIESIKSDQTIIKSGIKDLQSGLIKPSNKPGMEQMKKLVEEYKAEVAAGESSEYKVLIDKIQHFTSNVDDIKQDLSEKLTDGGFDDDVEWAMELKEAYSKKLLKNDVSRAQHKIHAFILAKIQMSFRRHVLSAIRNNEDKDTVRQIVDNRVINEIGDYLGYDNVLELYDDDINGMLYFLTGNCHIKWV